MSEQRRLVALLRTESLEGRRFTGHAAVFDTLASIGGHYESISRQAFDSALERDDDVQLTRDHDPSRLLARTTSGTLRLATDDVGLRVEADIAPTSDGNDVMVLLERGDLSSMSFMGLVAPGVGDRWDMAPDGRRRNEITDFERLVDVAVVTRPAYSGTDAILRSVEWANLPRITAREQTIRARARLLRKEIS
jgi:uncharacterized protein